ncbi:M15 family metallopeptidase [Polaribacter staleyi]|uniref:M15 family metallopeptidase n=1 Tax=Polaribacter staleyi TaxID=2022337 RepID=UPI0031BB42CF
MGVYKLFIKLSILLFFFGCINGCKKERKKVAEKTIAVAKKKDSLVLLPKYLTKNYVLGKFDYTKNPDFVIVPKENSSKKIYLRKEVLTAFLKMKNAAQKEGITLKVISGTRNFEHQKNIWNYKWNVKFKNLAPLKRAQKILEYSSMPSTSRHHWGTDLDLNSLSNTHFLHGQGKKTYDWLLKNAARFGFHQVYTSKENGRTGYQEEKWHWSYTPLSTLYLKFYNDNVILKDINGFKGHTFAKYLNVIQAYVNGINPIITNLNI